MSLTGLFLALVEISVALIVILVAWTRRKDQLLFAGIAMLLYFSSSAQFNRVTSAVLGFGAIWPMIFLAGLIVVLYFRLNPFRYPLYGRPVWIPYVLALVWVLVVWPWTLYPEVAVRNSLSFALVFFIGWLLTGRAVALDLDKSYLFMRTIVLVIALSGFAVGIIELVLAGPSMVSGGTSTTVIAGMEISRLSATVASTGLGMGMMLSIFGLLQLYQQSQNHRHRILFILGMVLALLIMILTGSRSPLVALFVLTLVLALIVITSRAFSPRTRRWGWIVLGVALLLPLLAWSAFFKPFILSRYGSLNLEQVDFLQILYYSRFYSIEEIVRFALEQGYNIWIGAGPKASTVLANSGWFITSFPIESYIPRMIFEWGIVGGSLYIFSTIALTISILRMEAVRRREGDPSAWLLTVWILIPWITFLFGYGFSTVDGKLVLILAIGSGASALNALRRKGEERASTRGTIVQTEKE